MTNSIHEIRNADCIFITGSNTAESHPVISYEVIRAVRKGAHLIIVDPRKVPLTDHATMHLQVKPGTDIYVFLAILHTILREGWDNKQFIQERTEGFDEFKKIVMNYSPEHAALMSGVPEQKIIEAARIYALGERNQGTSIYDSERGHSSILYAMGITQRSNGTEMVLTLANLAMLCGHIGKPSTGVNPLRGQSNVQGACDVGCLVNVFPGYLRVNDETSRIMLENAWAVPSLPGEIGLTIVEAMQSVKTGKIHAVYIMGENPMMTDPNTTHVEEALRSLDFLVVQDIFPSDTSLLAHIILPAASSLEKDGTFTNTDRRVQLIRPVIKAPGEALPDWEIIAEIAKRFDRKMGIERKEGYWDYDSTEEIFSELANVTPIYKGISHGRLMGDGIQWPCPHENHPGTKILHSAKFSRGLGKFTPITAKDPAEKTDDEFPLILTTGRVLFHYHSGTMTRRSKTLAWKEPGNYVEINPLDAEKYNAHDNQDILITSRHGSVRTRTKISTRVPEGTIFLAFHWREASANILTQDHTLDPVAKIPEYKICAVRIENPRNNG